VRAQIIELATAHRLVTRYTSFVAVDKTPVRPLEEDKLAAVPTLLPEGWEYDKVFGELPQGRDDSRFGLVRRQPRAPDCLCDAACAPEDFP